MTPPHTEPGVMLGTIGYMSPEQVRGQPADQRSDIFSLGASRKQLVASEVQESLNLTRLPLAPGGGSPGGPEEELSSGQVRDRYPTVSPDGRRILIATNRLGENAVWILTLDSRRWDAKHVAVTRLFADGTASLWFTAIDGSVAEELVSPRPAQTGYSCAFSPDGRTVLYQYRKGRYNQIFLLDVLSRQERQLTSSASDKYDAAWSPDGRWIVYSSNAGGSLQIWRIAATGSEEKVLTSGYERMRHVFYSPDGRWIYVQASHRNIYRIPADGGPLRRVTNFPESGLFIEEPTISPDGRFLVYCHGRGGSSLWILTLGEASIGDR